MKNLEGQIPYVKDWSAYYEARKKFDKKKRQQRYQKARPSYKPLPQSGWRLTGALSSEINKYSDFTEEELQMGLKNTAKMDIIMSNLTRNYLTFERAFDKNWKKSRVLIRDDILRRLELKIHFKFHDLNWAILKENWPELWNRSITKFMMWSLKTYNHDAGFKFSTFLINQLPVCMQLEFYDFFRRGPVHANYMWRKHMTGFDDIPDVFSYDMEDCLYNPNFALAVEFRNKFQMWD